MENRTHSRKKKVRENNFPQTLQEAIIYFKDPDTATTFMAQLRWPEGVACPICEGKEVSYLSTRRLWKCKACKKQFTVKLGSVMEDSPISLDKWLAAIWLIANAKNGISSYEIGRALDITQKSAWFLLHRIRLAMQSGTFQKLAGDVEIDETFIGGLAKNMHAKKKRHIGTGGAGKVAVMGMLERKGEVRAHVVPNVRMETLQGHVEQHVERGANVYTDQWPAYNGLNAEYNRQVINHSHEYVRGLVHTNGIENFWSLLKRSIKGTYVSVEPFHLFRYVDEQAFRFNTRKGNDADRFIAASKAVTGRRLTHAELTGKKTSH